MPQDRFKAVPAVYLVLLRNNNQEVLLHLRKNSGYMDGFYSLVAGHVEEGEMPIAAMIREAKEEAGIDVQKEDLTVAHTMYRVKDDSRLDLFITCSAWQGEVTNMEPEKCAGLSWFPIDALPENTIPYIKSGIAECIAQRTYSEFFE